MRILRQRKDLFVQKTGNYYRQPNGLAILRAVVETLKDKQIIKRHLTLHQSAVFVMFQSKGSNHG